MDPYKERKEKLTLLLVVLFVMLVVYVGAAWAGVAWEDYVSRSVGPTTTSTTTG